MENLPLKKRLTVKKYQFKLESKFAGMVAWPRYFHSSEFRHSIWLIFHKPHPTSPAQPLFPKQGQNTVTRLFVIAKWLPSQSPVQSFIQPTARINSIPLFVNGKSEKLWNSRKSSSSGSDGKRLFGLGLALHNGDVSVILFSHFVIKHIKRWARGGERGFTGKRVIMSKS